MKRIYAPIAVAFALFARAENLREVRIWHIVDGQGVEAAVIEVDHAAQSVRMRRSDGREFTSPFSHFVPEDAALLEGFSRPIVYTGRKGTLAYRPLNDSGDVVPDFSWCGYRGGGVPIPDIPVKGFLEPAGRGRDDTDRIQQAIDQLEALPPGSDGFRGALLLRKGVYRISGVLKISRSGVVLRGEGSGKDGTVLFAAGTVKRNLIEVDASAAEKVFAADPGTCVSITDAYVPVGARSFRVSSAEAFGRGDRILVTRNVNDAWIRAIGMDQIPELPGRVVVNWRARDYTVSYQRTVMAVEGNTVTIDAPVVCALDARWGGGEIQKYTDHRGSELGIERLRIVAEFDPSVTENGHYSDENKCGVGIRFNRVRNGWAQDIVGVHLDRLIEIGDASKWITVQDCAYVDPVSMVAGSRRYAFAISGEQNLVQRCYAESARHAFLFDALTPGPNVILDCMSKIDYGASEPHHRWSTGGLYDNFSGSLSIVNRWYWGTGHGWSGANYVAWNTEGALSLQSPPTAGNYSVGHVGEKKPPPFKDSPDGYWDFFGAHVEPRSLYLAQLLDRLGVRAVRAIATPEQLNGTIRHLLTRKYATAHDFKWGVGAKLEMSRYQ
jgi:hypothetical protein